MKKLTLFALMLLLGAASCAGADAIVLEIKQAKVSLPEQAAGAKTGAGDGPHTVLTAEWDFTVPQKAAYRVFVKLACPMPDRKTSLEIAVGNQKATCNVEAKGGYQTVQELDLGPILLRQVGPNKLIARAVRPPHQFSEGFKLISIRLVPES